MRVEGHQWRFHYAAAVVQSQERRVLPATPNTPESQRATEEFRDFNKPFSSRGNFNVSLNFVKRKDGLGEK